MRALISKAAGGPETLEVGELPDPVAGSGEVVVAVKACGVNFPDVLIIQDMYQRKPPRPFAPGAEIAGVVVSVGPDVTARKVGDRVSAFSTSGGMAERIKLRAIDAMPLPEWVSFEDAAGSALTYGTSYHALHDRGQLKAGETLLVLGAGGGVGIAAVEIGKAMGARVIAAVSSQDKLDAALAHGADGGFIYPREIDGPEASKKLADAFKAACAPQGAADVIYDPVGGPYSEPALRAAAWNGRFLVIGFPAGVAKVPLNLPLLKNCAIVGVAFGAFAIRDPAAALVNHNALMELFRRGALKPHISARFPLERGAEAIRALADRKALGKIIVTIS